MIAKGLRHDLLIAVLKKVQQKFAVKVYGLCLMANHLHLLIKPADAKEAIDRWQRMAGGSGELLTGHCLVADGQGATMACVSTVVQFAALRLGEIEAYVASGEPLNCAGGFALEGRGGLLIRGLNGCYSNVIGLSLPWLRTALEAHCAG